MKKILLATILLSLFLMAACRPSTPSVALEPASLQLQWITQAQFAGYYVALHKGWYREEGLDLTIRPGGPDIIAVDKVDAGESDFGTAFLADLSVAVQKGKRVISLSQIQQMSGLLLISKKSSGIRRPEDLIGKQIGIWGSSWESQLHALLAKEGISKEKVHIVPQGFDMQPFIRGELDVASAMIYNEYHTVLESGIKIQELNIIDYSLYGLGFPGDTLFTHPQTIKNNADLCLRMLRASMRGWQYAIDNPKEAVDIVMRYDTSGGEVKAHQLSMMREISRLVKVPWRELGYTDQTTVQQMNNILLRYGILDAPLKEPVYTNQFWDAITK